MRPSPVPASAAPPEPAPPSRVAPWLERAGVVLATVLAYSNTFDVPFQFDDYGLLANAALEDLSLLWPPAGPRWLGDLTFALNHRAGGWSPRGYHLVNVAVHAANALLVHALAATALATPGARRVDPGPLLRRFLPLVAALLFALHPLATQAVTYVVQRYASLATLFFVASIVLYLRARLTLDGEGGRASRRGWTLYVLSVIAAAAAMKTKQIAFTLPAVAAILDLVLLGGRPRSRLLLLAPLALAALLVPLAHLGAPADAWAPTATAETQAVSRWDYLLTQARVVTSYLRLLVYPAGQNFDHDVALSRSLLEPRVLASAALLAAIALGAAWLLAAARRSGRGPGLLVFAGTAWFFVTLSVESTVIPIRDLMVEHRTYLPLAGAALGIAAGLLWIAGRVPGRAPPAARCAVVLLLTAAPLGVAAHARNAVYRDELTLWSDVVAKSPAKARGHNYLGIAYGERGRADEAMAEFRAALALQPVYPDAAMNLGTMHRERGDYAEALRLFERAVRMDPKLAAARNNLGGMYELAGRGEEALREYREAVRLAPRLEEARRNLARLSATMGRPPPP